MDKTELGRRLLSVSYLEGDFVLHSGRRSRYYLDKYLFETDPTVLRGIVEHMGEMIRARAQTDGAYDRLAAVELGAVALGAGLSLELGLPLIIVRKQIKDYGTGRAMEGSFVPGERAVVVEDIVTSGASALAAVEVLRKAGLSVKDLFCVVDREEGGKDKAAAAGVELYPLFTASELGIKVGG